MPRLEKTIEAVFADRDIMPDEVLGVAEIGVVPQQPRLRRMDAQTASTASS